MNEALTLGLLPMLWIGAVDLAAWGLAWPIYARTLRSDEESLVERLALPLFIGLVVLAMGFFALGVTHLLQPGLLQVVIAVLAVAGAVLLFRSFAKHPPRAQQSWDPLLVAVGLFMLLRLGDCFIPILEWDSLTYHLQLPKLYLEAGSLFPFPYHLNANMPHNVEMLWGLAYAGGGITAAKLMSWQLDLVCVALFVVIAHRLKLPRLAGALPILYVSSPDVQLNFASLYVEGAIGCGLLFLFYLLLRFESERRTGMLILAGAIFGWVMGCKYTAWYFLAGVGMALIHAIWTDGRESPGARRRATFQFAAAALAGALPWFIRAAVLTGNPFFPNLHGFFGGRWWSPQLAMQFHGSMSHHKLLGEGMKNSPEAIFRTPWDLVMDPGAVYTIGGYSALLMLLFLAAPLFLWRAPKNLRYAVVCGASGFAIWLVTPVPNQARYLIALIPLMVISCALPLQFLYRDVWPRRLTTLALLLVFVLQASFPLPKLRALSVEGYQDYLSQNLGYDWNQVLNQRLPANAKVYFLFENRIFFLERPAWVDAVYEAPGSVEILRTYGSAAAAADYLRQQGFTHLAVHGGQMRKYTEQRHKTSVSHPEILPAAQFAAEVQMLKELLIEQSRAVGTVLELTLYRLGKAPARLGAIRETPRGSLGVHGVVQGDNTGFVDPVPGQTQLGLLRRRRQQPNPLSQ